MTSNYTLHLGDCLPLMQTMADKSIDCVVTDPPYGIGENSRKNASRHRDGGFIDYGFNEWDKERVSAKYIQQMLRVSRHQVIFGGNYYADMLPPSPSWIVWDKDNSGDFADCELAWTSHRKAIRKFKWTWNGFIKEKSETRYHLTQKPLALLVWVLENYTSPGDTILDPFAGSGTTGVAALLSGRNFIGVEKNESYFRIAQSRLANAVHIAAGRFHSVTGTDADFDSLPLFAAEIAP